MKLQINQPDKKLIINKTTIHLLTPIQNSRLEVPTEGCTPSCGSGLCFVVGVQAPVTQAAGQESK